MSNPTDSTQELEEILEGVANEYSAGGNYENAKPLMVEEAEQAVLDWHNKQTAELLDRVSVTFNDAHIDKVIEAERNKLKEVEL